MKKIKLFLGVFLLSIALVGCTSSKLSEDFDESKIKSNAQDIVQMFCKNEYDKVVDQMSDKLKGSIDAAKLKEVWEPVQEKLGEFKSVSKEAVVGKEVDGKDVATAVEIIEFENGKAQFTLTYNKEMKLEGLFIK